MRKTVFLFLVLFAFAGCVQNDKPQPEETHKQPAATDEPEKSPKKTAEAAQETDESEELARKVELPDDVTTADFEQLWFVSSQWGVGSYQEVVRNARNELCRRGTDIVDLILSKMPYEGGMQLRTLNMYFKALGDDAAPPLRKLLRSGDKALISNAINIVYELRYAGVNDEFKKMLEDEDYRLIAAKVLVRTGDKAGIEPLREVYPEVDELEKQRILRALMGLDAPELAPFYCSQCGADIVTVRRLAQNCLVKLGKPAVPVILAMMESSQLVQKRMLIEALGRIGEVECILVLLDLLSDDDWRVRFSAVFGLERCGDKLEGKHFMTLRAALVAEDNETVRQAIERLLDRE